MGNRVLCRLRFGEGGGSGTGTDLLSQKCPRVSRGRHREGGCKLGPAKHPRVEGQGVELGTEAPPQNHRDLRRKRPQRGQGATFSRRREWSVSARSGKIRVTGPSLPRDCDQRLQSQPRGFRVLALRELPPPPLLQEASLNPGDERRLPKRKLQSWNLEIPSPPHSAALVHSYPSCYSSRVPRQFPVLQDTVPC